MPDEGRIRSESISKNDAVIANQSADWCGNPSSENSLIQTASGDADCHTSDIGHWFAMTCLLTVRKARREKRGGLL